MIDTNNDNNTRPNMIKIYDTNVQIKMNVYSILNGLYKHKMQRLNKQLQLKSKDITKYVHFFEDQIQQNRTKLFTKLTKNIFIYMVF